MTTRCFGDGDDEYERYHDDEWGRPVEGERAVFERLTLEAFQSGLSWLIVLRKREGFRTAFHGFDPAGIARMDDGDVERLLTEPAIIRNRAKIEATVANARALLSFNGSGGSLSDLFWSHARIEDGAPPADLGAAPSFTPGSTALSKELKRIGFRFVGPTTAYAGMQAIGVVNDHLAGCSVRRDVENQRSAFLRRRHTR